MHSFGRPMAADGRGDPPVAALPGRRNRRLALPELAPTAKTPHTQVETHHRLTAILAPSADPTTMMKITLLIGALAVAKATVPDAVEACFVENGVSWNNHAPETAEQCLEHCDLMCGACKEITLENAADPGVLGALPEPPNGYGGILDCLCSQKAAVAAAAVNPDQSVLMGIMGGCVGAASAVKMEEAARALGIRVEVAALPEKTSHPSAAPAGAILLLGVAAVAAVVVQRRRAAAAADETPVAPMI